jgi:hypothetical protein
VFNEEFGSVTGPVHDGAHLLEALVNERNAIPLEHPITLHQASLVSRTLRNGPHDVGKEATVGATFAANNPESETAR